ncbi:MAG: hypothetical protein HZC41_14355 [Chloroflexi bacterium]|nr:hypothetical protein [Chloroflexota bacterium]
MLGRDGNISIIRVGTIAAIIGILVIIGGVVSFFIDRASHQVPLEIEVYPGAVLWGQRTHSGTARTVYYQVANASPDEVKDFYQQKMDQFYPSDVELELRTCKRSPLSGNFPEYDRGEPGVAAYQWSCMFDRSGFQITQSTRVNIQPGIQSNGTAGLTIVEYEQVWQR